ncbi:zinc finger protein 208-like [Centruroides sculpturatus]|uniref:zinc finger protein 208-like n=1 Tax=Centruroides sculpturatus TaxID=218467 RepID=UPI000C6E5AF1|nr:zinc finger protein 208-like [Centruroides sculpturatus]
MESENNSQKSPTESRDQISAATSTKKEDDKSQNGQHKQSSEKVLGCDFCTSWKKNLSTHKHHHPDENKSKNSHKSHSQSLDERSSAVSSGTRDKSQNCEHKQASQIAFRCEVCNYSASLKGNLSMHKQCHADEKKSKESAGKSDKQT